MAGTETALHHADDMLEKSLERLFAFLRIPSVSTQPAHAADCRAAADWLVQDLTSLGFKAEARTTPGHPIVLAHRPGPDGAPHVLFYGHYDVQPVDPISLWHSAPFEPVLKTREDGTKEIVARGAADDKGQVMTFIEACRALIAADGALPVSVTMVIEGEEESGGENLPPFLETYRDELKADVALICDTGMLAPDRPAITTMLRGMCAEEVTIRAAARDLHSGMYGNAAANPLQILCDVIAGLRDPQTGRVTLPGFYDGVPEISREIRDLWKKTGPSDAEMLGGVGLSHPAGEQGYSALEQTWARPSCEINGITGGYTEEGFKTVIPARATAKISFRLVGEQDPEAIRTALRSFITDRIPADCTAEFHAHGGSRASTVPGTLPALQLALAALRDEWNTEAAVIGCGGSIPVVGDLSRILGLDSLLVGFGLDDDRIHSPDEKYDLTSFHKGIRSWVRILAALGKGSA
ncbi:dipeptidase [Acetobacter sp. AN02]|uniref:dipeptidase n=1 Tax=Acetobacter sp. AN02 TaxID=2894186 RepID=UPI00243423C0|nr:dipeptidase [Acetobacter sp. AN02]MDG6094294.1 dipeptidase [Acetobacter sp. AN02]